MYICEEATLCPREAFVHQATKSPNVVLLLFLFLGADPPGPLLVSQSGVNNSKSNTLSLNHQGGELLLFAFIFIFFFLNSIICQIALSHYNFCHINVIHI